VATRLEGLAYDDDSQIWKLDACKLYNTALVAPSTAVSILAEKGEQL